MSIYGLCLLRLQISFESVVFLEIIHHFLATFYEIKNSKKKEIYKNVNDRQLFIHAKKAQRLFEMEFEMCLII